MNDRIMERAYKLRDDRESKRKEFVKECYDKQWRDACDDARTLDSQAMDKFLGQDRMATILEKQRRKQALSEAENLWMEEYARHCDKLEAIEKAKDDFRLKAAHDLQEGLRNQVFYYLFVIFSPLLLQIYLNFRCKKMKHA